ncbi:hypothetical protein [Rhodococcus cercidiphylli]|uniref:Transposase n=1 Tax=Rhodococcus cercidiphylli TaxID=489916 RepID=A0ABU4B3K0_9NOCA|nr:hypothetical protein [Rhodococcus cercidiphylli]MDV6233083.1 hypothetical protein [Rhodococcus cercidiphylli]
MIDGTLVHAKAIVLMHNTENPNVDRAEAIIPSTTLTAHKYRAISAATPKIALRAIIDPGDATQRRTSLGRTSENRIPRPCRQFADCRPSVGNYRSTITDGGADAARSPPHSIRRSRDRAGSIVLGCFLVQ